VSDVAEIRQAANEHAGRRGFADLRAPETMRAAFVRRQDTAMFGDLPADQRDPRRSVHVGEVPTPRPGPGEALVAVMAAGLNHNTVWSSIFQPEPGFNYLDRFALGGAGTGHALDYHVLGSDAAGVVLEVGPGPTRYQPGDEVTVCPTYVPNREISFTDDAIADPSLRAWGFETNFGALAQFALVRSGQLMPKPRHLSWEEAASLQLVSATCYRMLVGDHGARMRQGEIVLVWGAAGGLGSMAVQYVRNGGGIPVAVVSSPEKAALLRGAGVEAVIDRVAEGYRFLVDGEINLRDCLRLRRQIRRLVGDDPDIVFEHIGQATFPASIVVPRKGGRIVTCASTTGYRHIYDNRFLWMNVRSIIGSHGGTFEESWAANQLSCRAMIHPTIWSVVDLDRVGEAVATMHRNEHVGKVGVLCLAEAPGQGVRDPQTRARHVDAITHHHRFGPPATGDGGQQQTRTPTGTVPDGLPAGPPASG
jgi:crotonyl-CoA reductase